MKFINNDFTQGKIQDNNLFHALPHAKKKKKWKQLQWIIIILDINTYSNIYYIYISHLLRYFNC